jgi:hypothetical protein
VTSYVQHEPSGLHVPASAVDDNQENDKPMTSSNTDTTGELQPYRWTPEGELETDPRGITPVETADTKRVQSQRTSADEAELLLDIQQRDRSHLVDTKRVRKVRGRVAEAGKIKQLKSNVEFVALRDTRVRLWTTIAALVAAVAALGWSTASVQITAANGAPAYSPAWWMGFLVEPLISIGLLATIGVQAYAAMRGLVVDTSTESGRRLNHTQIWLLSLTVTLNVWPYVSPLWGAGEFDLVQVILHLVGPIVAVRMIHSLPAMWAVLENLPNAAARPVQVVDQVDAQPPTSPRGQGGRSGGPAQVIGGESTSPAGVDDEPAETISGPDQRTDAEAFAELREAVQSGRLDPRTSRPVDPDSASSIQRTLKVGRTRSRELRERWAQQD